MGRDQLFELFRFNGLFIRKRRTYVQTTNSYHWLKKYLNYAEHLILNASDQLWVSDITYIRTLQGFNYLSLNTDDYSKKIVGHCLYPTLEAICCIGALEMAIQS
jgi:transposase InsO family protein